jgi:hypothetical protein
MTVDARTYADRLSLLLPDGEAWNGDSNGTLALDDLLLALAHEAARLREMIDEGTYEAFFPDGNGDLIPEWERLLALDGTALTMSQRQAQVIAKLRGGEDPTLTNIEAKLDTFVSGAQVSEGNWERAQAGRDTVGIGIGTLQAIASLQYMPSLLGTPNDATVAFENGAFATGGPINARYGGSCRRYALPSAGSALRYDLSAVQTIKHFSCWLHKHGIGDARIEIQMRTSSISSWVTLQTIRVSTSWAKLVISIDSRAVSGFAAVRFRSIGSTTWDLVMSVVVAGDRDLTLEMRMLPLLGLQRHTQPEWACIGEYP